MRATLLLYALAITATSATAQTRVSAQDWEPMARQLAIDATGDTTISEPGALEPAPAPGDTVSVDPTTGVASGWRYEYPFDSGNPENLRVIAVRLVDGQDPSVEGPFTIWAPDNYSASRHPLPSYWPDSDTILTHAMSYDPGYDGWTIATVLDIYEDAQLDEFRLEYSRSYDAHVWKLSARSAACGAEVSYTYLISDEDHSAPSSAVGDGFVHYGGSAPGFELGSCRPVASEPGPEGARLSLGASFPNPAVSTAHVPIRLAADGHVRLDVLDALGRVVATLENGALPAGEHVATWNVERYPSGVYLLHLVGDDGANVRRVTVARGH